MTVSAKWGEVLQLLMNVKPNLAVRLRGMKVLTDEDDEVVIMPPASEAASLQRELLAEQSLLEELVAQVYRENKRVTMAPPDAGIRSARSGVQGGPAVESEAAKAEGIRRSFSLAQDLVRNKQFDRATPYLQKVVELEPANTRARILLAECFAKSDRMHDANGTLIAGAEMALAQGQLDDAEALAGRAARDGALQGTLLLGLVAMDRGNYREAETLFGEILVKSPAHPAATLNLARSHVRQGKLPRAIELYQELVRRHPGDMDAMQELADALAQTGRKPEAAAHFTKVASFYARQLHLDRAVAYARMALAQQPDNLDARNQLVSAYYYQGRKEELLDEYRALRGVYETQGASDDVARVDKKIADLEKVLAAGSAVADPPQDLGPPPKKGGAEVLGGASVGEELPAIELPESPLAAPAERAVDRADESQILNVMGMEREERVIGGVLDERAVALTAVPGQMGPPPLPEAPPDLPPDFSPPVLRGGAAALGGEEPPAPVASVWQSASDEPTVDEMLTDFARLFRETKRLRRLREIDEIKTAALFTIVDEVRRILLWSKSLFSAEADRMGELPVETQELFYQIAAKSPLLERLCSDLTEFTEMVDEEHTISEEPGDLLAACREAMEHVRALATVKQVELQFQAPDAPLILPFHGPKIVEVLRQLLSNSVKFTPKGGVVGVEVRELPAYAEVTVRDTGKAVIADPAAVFIRFRGISDSLSSKIKGRGIRMPIVQSIIESHAGHLVIQGVEGVGNRFMFTLPKSGRPPSLRNSKGPGGASESGV